VSDYLTGGGMAVLSLILYIVFAFPLFVIATKTGTENAWMAFVPILNIYLMVTVAGLEWWYLLLFFVPCVNLFVSIYVWWQICEARNKPGWVSLLMLVPVAGVIVPFYVAFAD
jgi:hypothetical protein